MENEQSFCENHARQVLNDLGKMAEVLGFKLNIDSCNIEVKQGLISIKGMTPDERVSKQKRTQEILQIVEGSKIPESLIVRARGFADEVQTQHAINLLHEFKIYNFALTKVGEVISQWE